MQYHAYVKKNPDEAKAIKVKFEQEASLKKRRSEEQKEDAIRQKKDVQEEKLENKQRKREEREKAAMKELRGSSADVESESDRSASSGSDSE